MDRVRFPALLGPWLDPTNTIDNVFDWTEQRPPMFHHFDNELGVPDYLVRTTEFTYSDNPIASVMTAVTQSGYVQFRSSAATVGRRRRYWASVAPSRTRWAECETCVIVSANKRGAPASLPALLEDL